MGQILIDGELYNSETGELINEVEQVEVEILEDNLPAIVCNGGTHIQTNTEQLKKELVKHLEKYNIEVTEDNEKDCTKLATELNKLSGDLDKKRKETASLIKKPADDLKSAVDELIALIQEKRTKILNDVSVFKEKRMNFLRDLLSEKINELYEINQVSEKYQVCNIEPLVLEGSLSKNKLSKSAIESLESMVRKVKSIEDKVTIRELQLELLCGNAGLITSIKLEEIQHIIEDDNYDELIKQMIDKRLEIQNEAKKVFELQEQQKKEAERLAEIKKQEEKENEQRKAREQQAEVEKSTGKKIVKIVAEFDVEVGVDVEDIKVLLKYKEKLSEMFSTLKDVSILNDK